MNKEEAKQLKFGDEIDYVKKDGRIIENAVVMSSNTRTVFGTPVIIVKAWIQDMNLWTGEVTEPYAIMRTLKPKQILRKV